MFKKVKKFDLRGRICAVAATERLIRMDILSGQNTECVNLTCLCISFLLPFYFSYALPKKSILAHILYHKFDLFEIYMLHI